MGKKRTAVQDVLDAAHYRDLLSTAARLDDICAECQRAVRDHLTRRV